MASCASNDPAPLPEPEVENVAYEVSEDYVAGVIRYTVQRGDRLGDIAQEFTGNAANWRDIAEFNNISNPRKLRAGYVLEIPTDLVPDYQSRGIVASAQPAILQPEIVQPEIVQPDITQASKPRPNFAQQETLQRESAQAQTASVLTASNSLAVKRPAPSRSALPDVVAPVVVTPIENNRSFDLNPIDSQSLAGSSGNYEGSSRQIKVVGSYYPKGIYSEPAAYSKLMMRVAPGTQFLLEQQVNDWYKIKTAKGTGFIRTSDAELLN